MIMKSFVISYSLYLYQRIFDELQSAPFLSPSVCIFTYLSKFRPLFTPKVKRNCASIPLLGRCGFEMSCKTCFSVNFFNLSLRSTRLSTCMRCLSSYLFSICWKDVTFGVKGFSSTCLFRDPYKTV